MTAKHSEKLHPRDRRGRWIKKLKALEVGEGLRGDFSGVGVKRTEQGFTVLNRDRIMGFPTTTEHATEEPQSFSMVSGFQKADSEDAMLRNVADSLRFPDIPEGAKGTLADPEVLNEIVDGYREGTFRAALTNVRYSEGTWKTTILEGITADTEKGVTGGWKIRLAQKPDGTWVAEHDEIVAPEAGGGGAGFFRYLEGVYAERGVTQVKLYAAMTRGGYVWAREGFRFRIPDSGTDPDKEERSAARSLLAERMSTWADEVLDPDYPHEHITREMVEEFLTHFAAVELPDEDEDSMWGIDVTMVSDERWEAEVERGEGGPYFQTPQEIAMYGVDDAWEEEHDGKTIKMWLGKHFLMGAKWYGVKDIPQALQEAAVHEGLLGIVNTLNAQWPDVNDWAFWREVKRQWDAQGWDARAAGALAEGWREWLHPRGRGGRWVEGAPGVPEMPAARARWLADSLDDLEFNGVTTHATRREAKGDYGRVTLRLERDGEQVGLAQFRVLPPQQDGRRYATIDNVYVREDARKTGVAASLLDEFYAQCRRNDVDMVKLETVDVGGFYWAMTGYEWPGNPDRAQREILSGAKADGRWAQIEEHDPEGARELAKLIALGHFPSEAKLAQWGRTKTWADAEGYVWWPGKRLMLGAKWKGERAP